MIENKMVISEVRKFRSPGRLHEIFFFYGGTYMWVLSMALASCHLSNIKNFEAAHKFFENLCSPGCYSFI